MIPARSTVWFITGNPASARTSHALTLSFVSSLGWLKCVITHSGWWGRSARTSSLVIRCGIVTGTRVAIRIVSTLSTARTAATRRTSSIGRHRERIAAAHDHVAHLRVRAEVGECRVERLERHRAAAVADDARTGAEPAIDGAPIRREEECPVGVALNEMRRDLVLDLAQRIGEIPVDLVGLPARRARTAAGPGTPDRAGRTRDR